MGRRATDLTGHRFGYLVVTGRAGSQGKSSTWWCQCDCGSQLKEVQSTNLIQGNCLSCGCLSRRHGMSGSRVYKIWTLMKDRRHNPNNDHYADYGGRGITVCSAWRDSFEAFYADMGDPPSEGHSIDRKKNELGYQPGNCRWATFVEQNNNNRRNVLLTYNERTQTIAQWAKDLGISQKTLGKRIRSGRSVERALTTEVQA